MRPLLLPLLALVWAGCQSAPSPEPVTEEARAPGQIQGVVLDAYEETPLAGVSLGLREGGPRVVSDASGRFVFEAVQPGTHRVVAEAEGYLSGARANVRVTAGEVTEIEVRLFSADPSQEQQERWLEESEQPDVPEDQGEVGIETGEEVGATSAALVDVEIPETIRVWRSQGTSLAPSASNGWADRSCEGEVQELDLEEYVKGVIPHEWIPSWHPEALRAGAIAARSYAASHAIAGGRWRCADVDDGTVTQVYDDDRAGPTDMAVDATAGVVVVRDGGVVRTEYSAENAHPTAGHDIDDPVCAGATLYGHGRGACQWGTQRWATASCFREPCSFGAHGADPKDHVWMMEHYYPGSELSTGEPAAPCAILGPTGGVLDDGGPCFSAYGPPEYWRTEAAGHEGGLHWTNAFQSDTPSNWAQWRIHLEEAGEYRVEVHVVDEFAEFGAARYGIRHDGTESEIVVDQGAARDGWLQIGTFPFAAGGDQHVSLYDDYDVSVPADQHIVADAIRLVAPGMPPVTDDASVPPPMVDDAGTMMPPATGDAATAPRLPGEGGVEGGCSASGSPAPDLAWLLLGLVGLARLRRPQRVTTPRI